MKGLPFTAILLMACATPRPSGPLPSSVRIRVTNPAEVVPTAPVRYAIVWTTKQGSSEGFVASGDGPVDGLTATITAPLALPEERVRNSLNPIERFALTATKYIDAYRPRFVIYGDENDNARFDPGVLGGVGPDSILGVDAESGAMLTAFVDLDGALRRLSLPETEAFYARNGGRYSPFVWAKRTGAGLTFTGADDVSVVISESRVAETDLGCSRNVSGYYRPRSGYFRPPTRAVVDTALDAASICGTAITDCNVADFAVLTPPSVEEDDAGDVQRLLQCRENDSLEFLLIVETAITCEGCACKADDHSELFVTTPADRPAWWPCGTSVPYCKSPLSADTFDFTCRAGGSDAGTGDAGGPADAGPG